MEAKILRTINTICLNFSPFPPRPQAMLSFLHPCTLCPVLKVFVHPNIVWRGEGRAIRGIQVVREVHIMLHLNIWKVKDVEGRFSITVPRIFVLHCSSRALGSAGSVRTIGLSANGCLHTKKGVTSKACRDSGRASFSSPLDQKEDERRRCSQGCTVELTAWKCVIPNVAKSKFWSNVQISFCEILVEQIAPCISTGRELSFEWSLQRISSADSKVRVTLQNSIKQSDSERDFFTKERSSWCSRVLFLN